TGVIAVVAQADALDGPLRTFESAGDGEVIAARRKHRERTLAAVSAAVGAHTTIPARAPERAWGGGAEAGGILRAEPTLVGCAEGNHFGSEREQVRTIGRGHDRVA